MKKFRSAIVVISLALALTICSAAIVRADDGSGPQGQKDSKSKNPPPKTDPDYGKWLLMVMALLAT